MIRYDLLSRNVEDKDIYKGIYDTRVKLKAEGKKAEQAPYKIILNSTYGICKDKYNPMYDPRQASNVCINGQLLLLDLLEHLEGHMELIQSNTDGLIIQIPDTDEAFDMVDDICYEWEYRTGMSLGFDVITEIWQKDVNNYIFRFENRKLERKGSYVKELSELDYDLAIVNKAIVDYITAGVPIEDTINNCTVYKDFQKVVKVSGKYVCGFKDGKPLKDKTFRVFASKSNKDGQIGKMKNKNGKMVVEKFANTPEHCFIDNEDINDKPIPEKLDRIYYIKLAYKRLKSFGFDDERLL
jgi:DNA polymerase